MAFKMKIMYENWFDYPLGVQSTENTPLIYDQRRVLNDLYVGYSNSINVKAIEINILYETIEYLPNWLSGN